MDQRPEQVFFDDPAMDRALGMIMHLAAELYVTRDRLRSLEKILEQRGLVEEGQLDRYRPDETERRALAEDRDAFVAHLMEIVMGRQAANGIT